MQKKSKKTIFLIRNIFKDAYGGAEKYQLILAKELKKNGYSPIIVTSSKKLQQEARTNGIVLLKAPYSAQQNWSGYRNLLLGFYVIWQLYLFFWYLHQIRKYQPFALNIQSRDDMIAATLAAKKLNKRIIWTDHTDLRLVVWENLNVKYKNPIGKYIYRHLANLPYKIVSICDNDYNYVNKLTSHSLSNLIVIKNGVIDENKGQDIKDYEGKVGYIGRLVDYKGITELIEAFKLASKQNKKLQLLIYGKGKEVDEVGYKELAKGARNITFMGYTDDPITALKGIDIFVLPSWHEGLSLSMLEATMMSKVIIATDVDGNTEIIKNLESGVVIKPKNVDELYKAIIAVTGDENLRKKLARNARKKYEMEFNFENIVKNKMVPLLYE